MSLLIDFIDETEEVKEEYVNLIREILGKAAQMEKIEDGAELSV
ncbi:rRNA maturation RNase YbeY, partial [Bacillus sp. B-TM1]